MARKEHKPFDSGHPRNTKADLSARVKHHKDEANKAFKANDYVTGHNHLNAYNSARDKQAEQASRTSKACTWQGFYGL